MRISLYIYFQADTAGNIGEVCAHRSKYIIRARLENVKHHSALGVAERYDITGLSCKSGNCCELDILLA